MPTYTYETIPTEPGGEPKRFEIRQSILDKALERHPETGEPVRRVITGGVGILGSSRGGAKPAPSRHGRSCCGGFR